MKTNTFSEYILAVVCLYQFSGTKGSNRLFLAYVSKNDFLSCSCIHADFNISIIRGGVRRKGQRREQRGRRETYTLSGSSSLSLGIKPPLLLPSYCGSISL